MAYTVYFTNFERHVRSNVDVDATVGLAHLWDSWTGKWSTAPIGKLVPEVRIWETADRKGQERGQALVVKNVRSGFANRDAPSWEAFIFHANAPLTRKIVSDIDDVMTEIDVRGGWKPWWDFDEHTSCWVLRVISSSTGSQVSTAVLVPRKVARKRLLRRQPQRPTIQRGWEAAHALMDPEYSEVDEYDPETGEYIRPILQYDLDGNAVGIV